MSNDELLATLERSPEVTAGLRLLERAISEEGGTGFLDHGSTSSNELSYFLALRREVHSLICTDDPRYKEQRKLLDKSGVGIVAFLSGATMATFGAPASLVGSLVAAAVYIPLTAMRSNGRA